MSMENVNVAELNKITWLSATKQYYEDPRRNRAIGQLETLSHLEVQLHITYKGIAKIAEGEGDYPELDLEVRKNSQAIIRELKEGTCVKRMSRV